MIKINYEKSVVKRFGCSSFELVEIFGKINDDEFKIILSSLHREARCEYGRLTDDQITSVLKKFRYLDCKRKDIIINNKEGA